MDNGSSQVIIAPVLLGDTNLDGQVNVADLANLAGNFGKTTGMSWVQGDFDYNSNVNVADLADLSENFGNVQGSGAGASASGASSAGAFTASSAVPEPAAIGMIIPSLALMIRRRRRV
jgi:hypothetical protein